MFPFIIDWPKQLLKEIENETVSLGVTAISLHILQLQPYLG